MFDVYKVIEELKKSDPNGFIIESHFQVQFGYALKRAYPDAKNIIFEWSKDKRRVDLVATVDDEVIGFEFKYFIKKQNLQLNNGLNVKLKDQVAKDILRLGFWKDVEKMEHFVKSTKDFNKAYCIALTNELGVFKNITDSNNEDKEFDISNGIKYPFTRMRFDKKGKRTHCVKITNQYDFKHTSYNDIFEQLIVEIK